MRRIFVEMTVLLALVLMAPSAYGDVAHTFKNDQFSEAIGSAAQELNGIALATQPGFVAGEAFASFYRPTAAMYPVKIEGVDVVMAGMPNDGPGSSAHATVEIYFVDGDGPEPGGAPVFTLSTHDVFNEFTMDLGAPLLGNTAMSFEFDWSDAAGHPPMLTQGNFIVAVRFQEPAASLQPEWGNSQCEIFPMLGMCGCQKVGTIHDQASTTHGNLLHIIYPPGNCEGAANKWVWFEDVGVTGDVILRARGTVADAPCTPSCQNKDCGDDGCGGSCGQCSDGESCVGGTCTACEPSCGDAECGDDGCGGSCGACAEGADCVQGTCVEDCAPVCDGKECGADQCGGSCGDCAGGETCNAAGLCIEEGVCDPAANCLGKECGTDGCEGLCGVCEEGLDCVQGLCTEGGGGEEGEFKVTSVSPEEGCNDEDTPIMIDGAGFVGEVQVYLGPYFLENMSVLDSQTIRAVVPAGMDTGTYNLKVSDGEDNSATFPAAFKVTRCGDTGCGVGDAPRAAGWGLLLLLAGLALAWRRVRA